MIALLADESLNGNIVIGLREKLPAVDLLTVIEEGFRAHSDQLLLERAAAEGRVVVSSDKHTMIGFANARIQARLPMPGLVYVPQRMPIGDAIHQLAIVTFCLNPGELDNQVLYLPL